MNDLSPEFAQGKEALPPNQEAFLRTLDFDKGQGLMPAVIQHVQSGAVLMVGYMNLEALRMTMDSAVVHFYSRSKQRLWKKGETSGNTLALHALRADCDRDCLLLQVMPSGAVCHTGQDTCWGPASAGTLARLEHRLVKRIADADVEQSYTAQLVAAGLPRMAQKVGEEGVECALAAVVGTPEALAGEAADLLYHLMLVLLQRGMCLKDVLTVLDERAVTPSHASKVALDQPLQ